jgi:hypothetical protein
MDVTALLRAFCDAVVRRDGAGFASLFSGDGIYHDAFYGAFVHTCLCLKLVRRRGRGALLRLLSK